MQTKKSKKTLPKTEAEITNGGVYIQRVRCGKLNCKCARGEHHTAFYFFIYRHGKNFKFYVRKAEVESFTRLVNLATAERKERRQSVKDSTDLLKTLRLSLSENDGQIKALRGSQNYGEN